MITNSHQHRICVAIVLVIATCGTTGCREQPTATESAESTEAISATDDSPPAHGFLGLTFETVETTPLRIKEPVPGSPAAEAGIRVGDLLIGVGDRHNPSLSDIYAVLVHTTPGERLNVKIARDTQVMDIELLLLSFKEVQSAMEATLPESAESK